MKTVETISDEEFHTFFEQLPPRVKLLVRAGFVDWKEVLPKYYELYVVE